eukprot:2101690-Rhodomonas_salina.1
MEPPKEKLLHGLINATFEELVTRRFGRQRWHAVKEKAGLTDVADGDFVDSQQYEQEVTYRIVGGLSLIHI